MSEDRDHQLSSYDYDLPQERIAQAPVEPRHSARLMLVPPRGMPNDAVRHGQVWDLLSELQAGDLLVVNDTRVLKARLKVRRAGGGTNYYWRDPDRLAVTATRDGPGSFCNCPDLMSAPGRRRARLRLALQPAGILVQEKWGSWSLGFMI